MKIITSRTSFLLALIVSASFSLTAEAEPAAPQQRQEHDGHATHEQTPPMTQRAPLQVQFADLRASAARLESALAMNHDGKSVMPGMGSVHDTDKRRGKHKHRDRDRDRDQDKKRSKDRKGADMDTMGDETSGDMGMGMRGKRSGSAGMGMHEKQKMRGVGDKDNMKRMGMTNQRGMQISALPGFPGASHIYHVGATGFFLDHADKIDLSTAQMVQLNELREAALLGQATAQRKIDQAEQELWQLTGADAPKARKIDGKVREIEKLRGDQRVAFIRAVGQSAKVLTDAQRRRLSGMPSAGSSTRG